MMDARQIAKNFSIAILSQGVAMLVSTVTSLLVPKVLGPTAFGYWQLFLFYASYVGFLSFGQTDGVYLIHGGESRASIDKRDINSQFVFALLVQIVIVILIGVCCALVPLEVERRTVLLLSGTYSLFFNLSCFLGFLFQGLNETKLYSYSIALSRIVFAVPLLLLVVAQHTGYYAYAISYIIGVAAQLAFCLYFARDFLQAGFTGLRKTFSSSITSMRTGISLTFANVASMLILGVSRIIVDHIWGIEAFGELSLSLSLVNFFLLFISQAAMVLFPALRQTDKNELNTFFSREYDIINVFFPFGYLLYHPAVSVLSRWLPQYAGSFTFLAYLLPICIFDSLMTLLVSTYYKVVRKERRLFMLNCLATVVSAAFSLFGAYVLKSPLATVTGAVITIVLRGFLASIGVLRELGLHLDVLDTSSLFLTICFVILTSLLPPMASLLAYACPLLAVTALHWRRGGRRRQTHVSDASASKE